MRLKMNLRKINHRKTLLVATLVVLITQAYGSSSNYNCKLKLNLNQPSSSDQVLEQVQSYLSGIPYSLSFEPTSQVQKQQRQFHIDYDCEYNTYVHTALGVMYDVNPRLKRASFAQATASPNDMYEDVNETTGLPGGQQGLNDFDMNMDGLDMYDYGDDDESVNVEVKGENVWTGYQKDTLPKAIPNQVFSKSLAEDVFIVPDTNESRPYDIKWTEEDDSDWWEYDKDSRTFYAMPFKAPSNAQAHANAPVSPGVRIFKLVSEDESAAASGSIEIGNDAAAVTSDSTDWMFKAMFKKDVEPRKTLLQFSKVLRTITGDERSASFVVKDFYMTEDNWVLDWQNQSIADGCEYRRWFLGKKGEKPELQGVVSPIEFITINPGEESAGRETGNFHENFANVVIDMKMKLTNIESIKVEKKPTLLDCYEPTTSSKPKTTTTTAEKPQANYTLNGGKDQFFDGNCGDDYVSEAVETRYANGKTYVLFSKNLTDPVTTSRNCFIEHGAVPAGHTVALTTTVKINEAQKDDYFKAFIQISKAARNSNMVVHKIGDGSSLEIILLEADGEKKAGELCNKLNRLNFLVEPLDCTKVAGFVNPATAAAPEPTSTTTVAPVIDSGGGLSVVLIVIIVAAALLFLLIGYKCYYDSQNKNTEPQYKPGTPSVFREEMDKKTSDRKPSTTLHQHADDGSATALLNTSSESEKAGAKHIVVAPPSYPN